MTDVLAERCAELAASVVPLMSSAIAGQGDPSKLDEVRTHLGAVRSTLQKPGAEAASDAYRDWAAVAAGLIDGMEAAAQERDSRAVWSLFTDPTNGFHRLGAICAGYPGW